VILVYIVLQISRISAVTGITLSLAGKFSDKPARGKVTSSEGGSSPASSLTNTTLLYRAYRIAAIVMAV